MLLLKLIRLKNQLENKRKKMHKLATIKGLSDPEVLNISWQIDKMVLNYQQIVSSAYNKRKYPNISS